MKVRIVVLLVTLASCILFAPFAADPQQAGKIARIGVLAASSREGVAPRVIDGFLEGLRDRGWIEGQNITIE